MKKRRSVREVFGEALVEIGGINPDVVVLAADISLAVKTDYFAQRYPERFFNMGVQEAGMVDNAVGFALAGLIPLANTFSTLFLRATEQIRTCVAYARTNVKLLGGYSGLSDFKDGATHHAIEDIAIMRALPNMVVVSPADATEVKKMLPLVVEYDGPVYMRVSRAEVPVVFGNAHKVEIGKGFVLRQGCDVTLIGTGVMVSRCLEAAEILAKKNISCRVINIHTIKPLDVSLIRQAAEETGAVVTAEEHSIVGGLAGAVAEVLGKECPVPIERVGIPDIFTESAQSYESLLDRYGMAVENIVQAAQLVTKRKKI